MKLSNEEMQLLMTTMTPHQRKDWIQEKVLRDWYRAGGKGTLEAATGIGKTRVALNAIKEQLLMKSDSIIYLAVPTETLRDDDWPAEAKKWHMESYLDCVKRVCWKSLHKEVVGDVDLLIGDEIHHSTPLNYQFFRNNKVEKVLGLTASLPKYNGPLDDQEKRILIDQVAPSFFKITLEEAVQLQLVSDFEVKVLLTPLDNTVRYIEGGKIGARFMTTEASHYIYLTKMLQKCAYSQNENLKFIWIQKRADFLRNLASKTQVAREVMQSLCKNGKRTLVFCGSIAQSQLLCGEDVYNSDTDDSKLQSFQKGELNTLGAVRALNEGKNIENLDQILIVDLDSKEKNAIQRIGRSIRWRPGHIGLVVILVTQGTANEKWYRTAFREFDKVRITEYIVHPQNPIYDGSTRSSTMA